MCTVSLVADTGSGPPSGAGYFAGWQLNVGTIGIGVCNSQITPGDSIPGKIWSGTCYYGENVAEQTTTSFR